MSCDCDPLRTLSNNSYRKVTNKAEARQKIYINKLQINMQAALSQRQNEVEWYLIADMTFAFRLKS